MAWRLTEAEMKRVGKRVADFRGRKPSPISAARRLETDFAQEGFRALDRPCVGAGTSPADRVYYRG